MAIIVKAHKPETNVSFVMKKGDSVYCEKRETEYDDWLWCTHSSGKSAWTPEPYLQEIDAARGKYKALCEYNADEICVDENTNVQILLIECAWALVKTDEITEGWIPLENLDIETSPEFEDSFLFDSHIL